APTTLNVAAASGTFGGTVSPTATLSSQGSGVSGKTIHFTVNGTSADGVTNASGVASVSGLSVGGLNAGDYAGAITASFAGDTNFGSSSGSAQLTITQASQTITFGMLAAKTFGDPDFTVSATSSSNLAVTFSAASGQCSVSGSTVH